MPRATDIIGYAIDGAIYCPDCINAVTDDTSDANEYITPIFAVDEDAHRYVCDDCIGHLIDD